MFASFKLLYIDRVKFSGRVRAKDVQTCRARGRHVEAMSASLSFLQSTCSSSLQIRFFPSSGAVAGGFSCSYKPLIVEAKARTRTEDRAARHARVRKKVEGTPERPRLCVFRSNKHLYVQVIDDTKMHTLASASTMQKPISEEFKLSSGPTTDIAKKVGEVIAKSCLEKGITSVAFDRGGYLYHGHSKALADAARENGLQF